MRVIEKGLNAVSRETRLFDGGCLRSGSGSRSIVVTECEGGM